MKEVLFYFFKKILYFTMAIVGGFLPQVLFLSFLQEFRNLPVTKKHSQYNLKDFEIQVQEEGVVVWKVFGDKAWSVDENIWKIEGIKGHYFSDQGKVLFKGDYGEVYMDERKVIFQENVRSQTQSGYFFVTDVLTVSEENQVQDFYTDSKVHLFSPSEKLDITAVGLKGNVKSGKVELLEKVRCEKDIQQYKNTVINSKRALIESSLSSVKFYENLVITQGEMKLKGEEAVFLLGAKGKDLDSIRMNGNIKATDGKKVALSESVEMRLQQDTIIFQGSPRVRMGENEVVGQEILITEGQKKIQVRQGNIKSLKEDLEKDYGTERK